ncbi:MAG: LamG domain-containing protein [Candidatus Poribacteria bacterium]|nr:LamG domain-containing protein [Candidatus Poribacteria bacterium]
MKQCAIFGLLALILISVSAVCSAQELVLHLSFDELNGDVAKDRSEFGNDATFKGKPKLIDGVFGQALEFDGKTSGQIPDHASLDIVNGITIEFWVIVKGGEAIQSGVEKGVAWVSGLYNLAALYNGGTILQFFDLPEPCNDDNIGPSIQDGEWHFLAGTWDGKDILLYIDGELEAEMPCKGELKPNDDPLFIGARGGSGRFLTGALDEIKVYNYALTKAELLKDMEEPVLLHVDAQDKLTTVWARLKTDESAQ